MTVSEFQDKYCMLCGTQRCLGQPEDFPHCGYYNGEIEIEKGYVDTRYLDSREVINKYLDKDILKIDSSLAFNPDEEVSKKEFIEMTNKILNTSYKESTSEDKMTLLDVANLLSNYNKNCN